MITTREVTTTDMVDHLVETHGNARGAYRTSNFPGYVDVNTIRRAALDALHTRANHWGDSGCSKCEVLAREATR
jgi:hypothetical protein